MPALMNFGAPFLSRLTWMIDVKRCSAWLLTEGLTSGEDVTSVVRVDI